MSKTIIILSVLSILTLAIVWITFYLRANKVTEKSIQRQHQENQKNKIYVRKYSEKRQFVQPSCHKVDPDFFCYHNGKCLTKRIGQSLWRPYCLCGANFTGPTCREQAIDLFHIYSFQINKSSRIELNLAAVFLVLFNLFKFL